MLSGTIEPLDLDIQALIAEEFSPAARSRALAAVAREELASAEEVNKVALGFVPSHSTVVDGVSGVPEDRVRPDGVIVYTFELQGELLTWIMDQLRTHAPVRSGRFRDSFELFADGQLVDPAAAIPPAAEYVFLSPLPYARKIEGSPGRPPESRQAPQGVFEAVAAMAASRFGNQARIRFSFAAPIGGQLVTGKGRAIAEARVPAITVSF